MRGGSADRDRSVPRPVPCHVVGSRRARTGNAASKYTHTHAQAHATPAHTTATFPFASRDVCTRYNNIIWRTAGRWRFSGSAAARACFRVDGTGRGRERYKTNICPTGCVRCVTAPSSAATRRRAESVLSPKTNTSVGEQAVQRAFGAVEHVDKAGRGPGGGRGVRERALSFMRDGRGGGPYAPRINRNVCCRSTGPLDRRP